MKRNAPNTVKGQRQAGAVARLEARLKLGDEQLVKTSVAFRKGRLELADAKAYRATLEAHLTHLKAHVS